MTGMDITSTLTCALAGHMNVVSSCSPWSRCSGYLWSNPERSSALGIDTHWGFAANGYVEYVDTDWAGRRGRGFAASPGTVRAKLTLTRTGTGRNSVWQGRVAFLMPEEGARALPISDSHHRETTCITRTKRTRNRRVN